MEYKKDSSNNDYLEVSLGWDDPLAKLRLTFIKNQKTIRLNKMDETNHIYPGPEFELKFAPELIEALAKAYNDNNRK
jgi:hypothetical protein